MSIRTDQEVKALRLRVGYLEEDLKALRRDFNDLLEAMKKHFSHVEPPQPWNDEPSPGEPRIDKRSREYRQSIGR
jgi:hypothetical protein